MQLFSCGSPHYQCKILTCNTIYNCGDVLTTLDLLKSGNITPHGGTKHIYIRGGKSNTSGLEYYQKWYFLVQKRLQLCTQYFLASNIVKLIFFASLEAILTFICIVSGHFMFIYRFLSIKWGDIFGLQWSWSDILGCFKISWTDSPYAYVLSAPPGHNPSLFVIATKGEKFRKAFPGTVSGHSTNVKISHDLC